MKKIIVFCCVLTLMSTLLIGCTLTTPVGTVTLTYDKNNVSDNIVYTDDNGKEQNFDTKDINGQIDSMLEDVDLPNGATTEELKNFVNDSMDTLNLDDNINEIQETLDNTMEQGKEEISENSEIVNSGSTENENNENTIENNENIQ